MVRLAAGICFLFITQGLEPGTAIIEGSSVRIGTTDPVSGALVELHVADAGSVSDYYSNPLAYSLLKRRAYSTTTTDAGGKFWFRNVAPGRYRISVTRNGFVRTEYGQRGANLEGAVVSVTASEHITKIVIPIARERVITGSIRDENDSAVPFASVAAFSVNYLLDGLRQLHLVASVDTNDRGEYRLFGLRPGFYYVRVDNNNNLARHEKLPGIRQFNPNLAVPRVDAYPSYYFPSTVELASAQRIHLTEANDLTGIDFKISPVPMPSISGSITNMPRSNSVQIMLAPTEVEALPSFRYRADAKGNFEIKSVAPGTYRLRAIATLEDLCSPAVPVVVGKDGVSGVTIPLFSRPPVQGRVSVDKSAAAVPFDVSAVSMRFQGLGGISTTFFARLSPDGTYKTSEGFPGEFSLSINGMPPEFYIKTILVGSREIQGEVRIVSEPSLSIDVIVSSHKGVVSGVVMTADQQPVSGSMVVLVPDESQSQRRMDRFKKTTTDTGGKFSITSVPPGSYMAFAFDELDDNGYYSSELLRRHAAWGSKVVVEENQNVSIPLRAASFLER